MPISFTGDGDDGSTSLLGDERVRKDDPRIAACGDLDEASACLGLARAVSRNEDARLVISTIQRDLHGVMAEVVAPPESAARFRTVDATRVAWLEDVIRRWEAFVSMPVGFILPGDCLGSAAAAVARTVVRRAERSVSALTLSGQLENLDLLRYLNRLSSLCYVLELLENREAGIERPTPARSPSP
ncbi:MAG: cob(I)yrinic acid a,c-diamide adenosyltransferase [Chloroflexi bacterium]|nr:cob(I)yrinic acid a,c-diamide adenosyltransferase [Chloroflexota bacterium]